MFKPLTRLPSGTLLLAVVVATLLASCGVVYHLPVYQGNLLETKNVEQLQKGMTKAQVLQLLGTPSVADPFHTSRWDYIASERTGRGIRRTEVKTLTLLFNDQTLTAWEGEYFPEQDEQLAKQMRKFGNLPKEKKRPGGGG